MQSLLEKYLNVNPKTLNPFNCDHHDLIPSDDPEADAAFLAAVAAGEVDRFFVTLVELCHKAGRYEVVCYDSFNGNVLFTTPIRSKRPFVNYDEILIASLQAAIAVAAQHNVAFRPEAVVVFSDRGHEQAKLLKRYAAGMEERELVGVHHG